MRRKSRAAVINRLSSTGMTAYRHSRGWRHMYAKPSRGAAKPSRKADRPVRVVGRSRLVMALDGTAQPTPSGKAFARALQVPVPRVLRGTLAGRVRLVRGRTRPAVRPVRQVKPA